ncbi:type II toxin-antitoxin system RelE/ParE family toxin [Bradyrhizobium brasilense]|uniref:Type II toxin-antitoxin system RelE/ParE family toxin n=1 Tax=Bradyrhizobium brasilense TaxID=1419277 RepID=A0ABY8JBB8_9BRAD|nr:type II toxin-antitoxin system RelE/ParE family toxin [Bradyrhizobium brasilense]WFU62474.1 type II toxin-antitoxin system RelE/ParE family toxin [Bradyrhizobium brasilense]
MSRSAFWARQLPASGARPCLKRDFKDSRSAGGAVSELRIGHGPGYRVYYIWRVTVVVILLCGRDKRNQSKDIRKAKEIAEILEG